MLRLRAGEQDVRLSVRVGLAARLLGDGVGIPSRMLKPFSSPNDSERPFGLGSGRLLSGPAMLESISCDDRRCILMACEVKELDEGEELCEWDRPG